MAQIVILVPNRYVTGAIHGWNIHGKAAADVRTYIVVIARMIDSHIMNFVEYVSDPRIVVRVAPRVMINAMMIGTDVDGVCR